MQFWAIAYEFQEDVFVNTETNEDTMDLTEKCLLPSESLAQKLITEEFGDGYVPVKIELERLERNGIFTWSRGKVERWDKQ